MFAKMRFSFLGFLQNRKRIILVGYRKDLKINIPDIKPAYDNQFTVQSIFADLPKLQAGQGSDKNGSYSYHTNDYLNSSNIRNGIEVLTQHVSRPHTEQDKAIYKIAKLSFHEEDWATWNFMQWFVKEQTEEETLVLDLLNKMKIAGGEKISNDALYSLDRDLEKTPGDSRLAQDVTAENP